MKDEVCAQALQYLWICLVGVIFTAMYNVCTGILRAVGSPKTPLYGSMLSSLINIAVDIIAIAWLNMDIPGTAYLFVYYFLFWKEIQ